MKKFILILSHLLILSFLVSCRESINDPTSEEIIDEKPFIVALKDIQKPSERVIWESGKTQEIEWIVTQNLDKVKILLLKKFVEVAVINQSTENDGSYLWKIPSDLPSSHHYRIKLISPYNLSAAATSVEFEIKNQQYVVFDGE